MKLICTRCGQTFSGVHFCANTCVSNAAPVINVNQTIPATPGALVKYKYVKYDTGDGYIREGLEAQPDGHWYKAADVEALLTDPQRLAAYLSSEEFRHLLEATLKGRTA